MLFFFCVVWRTQPLGAKHESAVNLADDASGEGPGKGELGLPAYVDEM